MRANLKRHNRVYILSSKHSYRPMRACVAAHLFDKKWSRLFSFFFFKAAVSAICTPPQPGDESYETFIKVRTKSVFFIFIIPRITT